MKFEALDLIYIILIFQAGLFSVFLFSRKNKSISNYVLAIQLLSQAGGIFSSLCISQSEYFDNVFPSLKYVGYPFMALWGPTFYIYVKLTAYKDFKLKISHLIHFIPFIIYTLFFIIVAFNVQYLIESVLRVSYEYIFFYFNVFIRVHVLFYIILSLQILYNVREKLKENFSSTTLTNFSWMKFLVYGFTICYILTIPVAVSRYIIISYSGLTELFIVMPYFVYFNIIFFKAWYQPEIFAGVEENIKYKSSKLTKDEAKNWINKLSNYIDVNKPYLNPDLTLNQLAEDLKINARILSQVINEYFNQNFYDYINKLRVEESKKMLLDNAYKRTISEILYEVGFNSKSAYNIAFKRATGITPTEFRKNAEKETVHQ